MKSLFYIEIRIVFQYVSYAINILSYFSVFLTSRQAVGLEYDNATWPQAKVKCRPSVPTALQRVLPMGLARIVAVAHSGVMRRQQADAFQLKYKGFQLISYPNARTTSG
ncbi:MAG: hypothetical protein RIS47_1458 [Bacteroidota bacterium]|jgi:hypothetical protein